MSELLRGLLKSPVSTISAKNVRPESARTVHHHPQHCSDQWECSERHQVCGSNVKQEFGSDQNCIANVKMEETISDEEFWKQFSDEGKVTKVKQENIEEYIDGVYYSYTIDGPQQGWMEPQGHYEQQCVSPNQLVRSPHLDRNRPYFLGKEKSKRFATMNVVTPLDTPSPQAYSPSGVPDFAQEGFLVSCFGTGYGYDGPFEDSLLSPPESLDFSSMDSVKGVSLEDCGGIYELEMMDPDWLNEPISLPTPDEQEGDITPYTNLTEVTLPLTPATSHPPTPLSTSPNSDVEEVLSLFSDQNSNDSPPTFNYFPLGQSFDSFDSSGTFESSQEDSQYGSPCLTPLSSPYSTDSPYMVYDDCSLPGPSHSVGYNTSDSQIAIKGLLSKRDSSSSLESSLETGSDRKRKTKSSSSAPKPKRRLTVAAKKERKREQNKNAALRYRQKKKEEKHGCFSKLDTLEEKNAELKKTVSTMMAEINYLKKLWSEVSTAKKLKQNQQQILYAC